MSTLSTSVKLFLDSEKFHKGLDKAMAAGEKFGHAMGTAFKGTAVAVGAVATAVAGIAKKSVEAYAEFEQLKGGVETLFKDSSDTVMEYAQNAYKTAGMSANQYMESVMGFSSALINSLSTETNKSTVESIKALDTQYKETEKNASKSVDLLKASQDKEVTAFEKATDAKIAQIDRQYKENLKLIDEEKYNALKALDAQIDAINAQSDAEEKAREQKEREEKIANLQSAISAAETAEEKQEAEKALADYREQIAMQERNEQRKAQIAELQEQKEAVKERADAKKEALKEQYDAEKTLVKEASADQLKELKAAQKTELEALKEANKEKLAEAKAYVKEQKAILEAEKNTTVYSAEAYAEAAELSDMALRDIADNANKFGKFTAEELSNVYSALARGQYQTLDNLQLGVSGTKEGMQQLIDRANEYARSQGEAGNLTMNSYADIIKAIHLVQEQMDITGTTEKEAATTIQGSMNMAKGAWENLLTGLADGDADVEQLVNNLVESVSVAASNIIPAFMNALGSIPSALGMIVEKIVEYLPQLIVDIVPKLMNAAIDIIQALINAMPQLVNAVLKVAPQLFEASLMLLMALGNGIGKNLPELIPSIISIVLEMVTVLFDNVPLLVDAAKELLFGLVYGIAQATPDLLLAIGGMTASLLRAVYDFLNIGSLLETGKNLIKGLWNGIVSVKDWILDKIHGFTSAITDGIKDFFGIHSPSKLFEDEIGKNLALGVGVGFTTNMDEVEADMQRALPSALDVEAGLTTTIGNSPLTDGIDELIAMFKYGTAKTSVENTRDLRRAVNA